MTNGTWRGVFGMVQRHEKKFTINALALDIHRGKSFDFSTTLSVDGFGAFLMSPPPLPHWMSIARVFRGRTWLATFSALVAVTCFRLVQVSPSGWPAAPPGWPHSWPHLLQVSPVLQSGPAAPPGLPHSWHHLLHVTRLLQAALASILATGELRTSTFTTPVSLLQEWVGRRWTQDGAVNSAPRGGASVWLDTQRPLVGQNVPRLPLNLTARTLVALWLFQCFIITVAYTSNLVGIFTRPAYPHRLHDLLDLLDSGYRSGVEAALTHCR